MDFNIQRGGLINPFMNFLMIHLMSKIMYWETPKKIFVWWKGKKHSSDIDLWVLVFSDVRSCDMLTLFRRSILLWQYHIYIDWVMFYYLKKVFRFSCLNLLFVCLFIFFFLSTDLYVGLFFCRVSCRFYWYHCVLLLFDHFLFHLLGGSGD